MDVVIADARGRGALADHGHLSCRKREVIDFLLSGLSNKEIASKVNISERTFKFHVTEVLSKFGVPRRSGLMPLHFQGRLTPHRESASG